MVISFKRLFGSGGEMRITRYVSERDMECFISRITGAEDLFRYGSKKPEDEYGDIELAKYIPVTILIPNKELSDKIGIDTSWIDKSLREEK